jgi:hypothetical protein
MNSLLFKTTILALGLFLLAENLHSQTQLLCTKSVFTSTNSITVKHSRAINTLEYDIDLQKPFKENCVNLEIYTRVDSYNGKGGTYTVLLKENGRVVKSWKGQHQTRNNSAVISVNSKNYNQFTIEIVDVINCYPVHDYPEDTPYIEVHTTSLKDIFQKD